MDRGYESYNVMAHCQEKGWRYLIRIKDGYYGIKGKSLLPATPCFDQTFHLILCRKQTKDWKQVYQQFPNHFRFLPRKCKFDFLPSKTRKCDPLDYYVLDFRMVRLEVTPGNYETLVTNTDYEVETLKNLYASRWGIETSFRQLKYSIGLVNFHAKKKEGILQEIYARLINFNFCQWLTSQVAIKRSGRSYDYQICFSDAAYASRLFFLGVLSSSEVETYLKKHLTPIRPSRTFKRRMRAQTVVSFTYRVS